MDTVADGLGDPSGYHGHSDPDWACLRLRLEKDAQHQAHRASVLAVHDLLPGAIQPFCGGPPPPPLPRRMFPLFSPWPGFFSSFPSPPPPSSSPPPSSPP